MEDSTLVDYTLLDQTFFSGAILGRGRRVVRRRGMRSIVVDPKDLQIYLPITSTDLVDEATQIWQDDDISGRDIEAGRIQLYGHDGDALPTTADYLWCPEVGRLGIADGANAFWLDAESLDKGILDWLSDEVGQ